ncbi:flagellin [Salinibacter ruber]|nr:flagellin [Salinibacter ruber]MCS4034369.1 flagellin [Salinibacter ruber]
MGLTFQTGSESDQTFDVNIQNSTAKDLGVASDFDVTSTTGTDAGQNVESGDFTSTPSQVTAITTGSNLTVPASGTDLAGDLEGGKFNMTVNKTGSKTVKFNVEDGGTFTATGTAANDTSFGTNNPDITLSSDGSNTIKFSASDVKFAPSNLSTSTNKSFTVEVKDKVNIGSRLEGSGGEEARKIIDDVDSAINSLTSQLSDLGASQNRLSFKESNLETSQTNLQAAQSRIQDADFAKEQTQAAKLQVQQQSGTAQLAQANAAGQSVLSLLQ